LDDRRGAAVTAARAIALALAMTAAGARAQEFPPEVHLGSEGPGPATDIDLENLVTAAAKSATTIQEAPGIVTVLDADDLRRWGYRTLEDALGDIPGWGHYPVFGEIFPGNTVRGTAQAMLLLHDGVSLFDPFGNAPGTGRGLPLESIKRVEVVTGPGGVLWGANSFLGIVNVITKDAADVDGIEASVAYGDGRGNQSDVRAYAMVGRSLLGGRAELFAHAAYENYEGQQIDARQLFVHPPAPQPNGRAIFGVFGSSDQPRSWLANFDGKLLAGPFALYWLWTSGAMHHPATLSLGLVQQDVDSAVDPMGTGRDNRVDVYDRMVALEYRDRFAGGRAGLSAKVYGLETVVDFNNFLVLPPSSLVVGGVVFRTQPQNGGNRAGVTFDGDVALPLGNRLLWGGEVFREWTSGSTAEFLSPDPAQLGVNRLPFPCPYDASGTRFVPHCPVVFIFPASRDVAAAFVSDQWRPLPQLALNAGVRVQAGFGERSYDPLTLADATLVWNFLPSWHLKLNFAQGFRPPVFNNTDSNGASVVIAGNRNIQNEFSNSAQGEVNARLLRGVRHIRELTLRLDYSYSVLDHVIEVTNGRYDNSARRGISSSEVLARLYLTGDHRIQLGYSFLRIVDSGKGYVLSAPNHWITLAGSFTLVPGRLEATTSLYVAAATEDPNRVASVDPARCPPGVPPSPAVCGADARTSDLTLDRLPAVALWNVGLRWRSVRIPGLEIDGFIANVLDQRWYYPDAFYDLTPQLEISPYPGLGRSFMVRARRRF
jgi:outer membrane receptor protein involved in Fe transport